MGTIRVRDETSAGAGSTERILEFPVEVVTAEELLRRHVWQEVHEAAARGGAAADAAWPAAWDRTRRAFELGRIMLLLEDRQVESLAEAVELRPGRVATFLRLLPLAGG